MLVTSLTVSNQRAQFLLLGKGKVNSIGIRILKGKTQTTGRSTVLLSLPSLDTCFLAFLTTAVVNRISKHRES